MVAIELSLEQLKNALKQLSPAEKIELSDVIWDDDIEVPIEHIELVRERRKMAKEHPEMMLDWDVAIKTLRP